jgi:hypothetical protein
MKKNIKNLYDTRFLKLWNIIRRESNYYKLLNKNLLFKEGCDAKKDTQ